jgi:putative hydrolase of the HAD superfamily
MQPLKNLIFDIGDVIVDIDYLVTIAEFQKLAIVDFSEIVSYSKQNHIFDLFETGKISAAQFRDALKPFLKPNTSDEQITAAWNSILIHYPEQKIDLLRILKQRYKTFALSNINEIHVDSLNVAAREKFGVDSFGIFFHTAYYSNEVGFRKPDKAIYEFVLQKENLIPEETFFVDDKAENVEAAKALGIRAYQLTDRNKLEALLAELHII